MHGEPVAGVLLAAGAGRRLGRGPKALLRLGTGTTLVEHVAGVLAGGGCHMVVVVLGAGAAEISTLPGLEGCLLVGNPDWETGMGSSLRAGLGAVPEGWGAMVALADQPGLDAVAVRRLLEAHPPGRITAAGYARGPGAGLRRGHPILFGAADVSGAAQAAEGDAGARAYLSENSGRVDLVDCSDRSDGGDVDTESDLPRLG